MIVTWPRAGRVSSYEVDVRASGGLLSYQLGRRASSTTVVLVAGEHVRSVRVTATGTDGLVGPAVTARSVRTAKAKAKAKRTGHAR